MITVAIPTIPGREALLERATMSVLTQTIPCKIKIWEDNAREGAATTRNKMLAEIDTEWTAWLDDDDALKPNHLRACARNAYLTDADVVYPGYDVVGGDDIVGCFGLGFDAARLRRHNYIPVTTLTKTELIRDVGGFQAHPDENGDPCEDWGLWLALLEAGATFSHLPQRTWIWTVNGGTRGRGDR